MIHIVTPENEHHYRDEMEQAYHLRHRVFIEQKGWHALAKPDGREIDHSRTGTLTGGLDIGEDFRSPSGRLCPPT